MILKNFATGSVVSQSGTGHLGDSYVGSASVRAGNGTMVSGSPALRRLM
jgi:hypothetical protein